MNEKPEDLLNVGEAAEYVGMTKANFWAYNRQGRGPDGMAINGKVCYRRRVLDDWKVGLKRRGNQIKNPVVLNFIIATESKDKLKKEARKQDMKTGTLARKIINEWLDQNTDSE